MSTALPDAQGTVHESGSRAQTLCQAFQATVARAPDAAGSKANELGLEPGDQARMVANPRIREHIDEAVARANDRSHAWSRSSVTRCWTTNGCPAGMS